MHSYFSFFLAKLSIFAGKKTGGLKENPAGRGRTSAKNLNIMKKIALAIVGLVKESDKMRWSNIFVILIRK